MLKVSKSAKPHTRGGGKMGAIYPGAVPFLQSQEQQHISHTHTQNPVAVIERILDFDAMVEAANYWYTGRKSTCI
jgi:hypothetical protein